MFTLPDLAYANNALEPHMSAQTLETHHGKHHQTYVDTLNTLVKDGPMANLSLEDIITQTHGDIGKVKIFNNAAQAWNHDFFWKSLSPRGGGIPTGDIRDRIENDIGDYATFAAAFKKAAVEQFGSGWVWLAESRGELVIKASHDADLPMLDGETALITCDLWEHAYYLDFQNRRPDFIQSFLDHLINWDFANNNLSAAAAVPQKAYSVVDS